MKETIIRKTKSLCSECSQEVPAEVIDQQGTIFLRKYCSQHGQQDAYLAKGPDYKNLEQFYFPIRNYNCTQSVARVELILTFRCNMDCPVCYLGDFKKQLAAIEPSCQEIEHFVKSSKYQVFVLSGGEATCRDDLEEIIKILKKYNKTVVMNTNALKFADIKYVQKLKQAGLDRANIQFAGFDEKAEIYLRGKNYIPQKIQALQNLTTEAIPTGINALIAGNLNEKQILKIINYALAHPNVGMVNFNALIYIGYTKDFPKERYLMPDDILKTLEEQSHGKIKRHNVYLFKKLEVAIASLFNKDTCFYHQTYILVREKDSYEPIDQYIHLESLEKYLNQYKSIYVKNKLIAKTYLLLVLPWVGLFHSKFLKIGKEIFITLFSYFSRRKKFLKTQRFIYLLFSVECDPYRIDYTINKSCPCKSIFFFDKGKKGEFQKKSTPIESTYWLLWEENAQDEK